MGTLPSPNLSPPSPVASIVAMDDDEVEPVATINDSAIDIDQEAPPTLEQNYDFGSGQALSGLLSLPDFVNTFDQLTPALQSYFIFTFLKRSPIPVLQTLNNIIAPSLRRDFLTDLPPELGVHILGYLDARALCRATRVCARWRRLVDGEWRVWKERLTGDELWIGDGTEAREAREITEGSKENVFLKRWNAGVWDEPNVSAVTSSVRLDLMIFPALLSPLVESPKRSKRNENRTVCNWTPPIDSLPGISPAPPISPLPPPPANLLPSPPVITSTLSKRSTAAVL